MGLDGEYAQGPVQGVSARGQGLGDGEGDHVRHPAGQPAPVAMPDRSYDANPGQRLMEVNKMLL